MGGQDARIGKHTFTANSKTKCFKIVFRKIHILNIPYRRDTKSAHKNNGCREGSRLLSKSSKIEKVHFLRRNIDKFQMFTTFYNLACSFSAVDAAQNVPYEGEKPFGIIIEAISPGPSSPQEKDGDGGALEGKGGGGNI